MLSIQILDILKSMKKIKKLQKALSKKQHSRKKEIQLLNQTII